MQDGFVVSPPQIHHEAGTFTQGSTELSAALDQWRTSLNALGNLCGTDQPGLAFASYLNPSRHVVEKNLESLALGIMSVHEGLHTMADNSADVDQGNASSLSAGHAVE